MKIEDKSLKVVKVMDECLEVIDALDAECGLTFLTMVAVALIEKTVHNPARSPSQMIDKINFAFGLKKSTLELTNH